MAGARRNARGRLEKTARARCKPALTQGEGSSHPKHVSCYGGSRSYTQGGLPVKKGRQNCRRPASTYRKHAFYATAVRRRPIAISRTWFRNIERCSASSLEISGAIS